MPTRSEAVKTFLAAKGTSDLASKYHLGMECQVNVAQGLGERTDGEFKGRKWHGWSDGITTWKSFRIPYKAMSEPEYTDTEIKFDLAIHADGIGMTGWNWQTRRSEWVAFDFDALVGHSDKHLAKLKPDELQIVREAASSIPWVTTRYSASGKGLHLYVHLNPTVATANHTEHAALARAILGLMSALSGFDFQSKVDICGGNMWVWHRKGERNAEAFKTISQGQMLTEIPPNWKDHMHVIKGSRRKNLPQDISARDNVDLFDDLTSQRAHVTLDEKHRELITWLKNNDALWWWDQDHHMLVTHTWWLQEAHNELGLKGSFKTDSQGKDKHEQNCFCFPMRRGAWSVRRYSPGVSEHLSWRQDGSGWTTTYLNREPDFLTACRSCGGLEDPKGGFSFREAEMAADAARQLGVELRLPTFKAGQPCILRLHKDGRLIAELEHQPTDDSGKLVGWLFDKKKSWIKISDRRITDHSNELETTNYDDMLRHLVTEANDDYGWMIKSGDTWRTEPLTHVKSALASLGMNSKEINSLVGSSIFKAWTVVNKPFQPEYPGDREWNLNSAQLRFAPSDKESPLHYPHWAAVLKHCGAGLDDAVSNNTWCKGNGILNGSDYLKCWIASLFQHPLEPLPYLFFYGPQNSGKSIFHESLQLLLTRGYRRADLALTNSSGFNGELEGAVLCVVEETNLKANKQAYNRIKDWVTSLQLMVRHMYRTPYHVVNSTHWVQCANEHDYVPVFPGDTRITISYVECLQPHEIIPKRILMEQLEKEAPDFVAEITGLEIPVSPDRLNIPIVESADKEMIQRLNQSPLEAFLEDFCRYAPGYTIKLSIFHDKFIEQCDPNEVHNWGIRKFSRYLPPQYPKGRRSSDGAQFHIGNITWQSDEELTEKPKLALRDDGFLRDVGE